MTDGPVIHAVRRLALAAGLLSLLSLLAPPVRAGEPPAPGELVRRLGSTSYAEREEASRALGRLGEKALPPLHAAERDVDPEVRRRAAALSAAIEERLLRDALFEARPVRFRFDNVPLRHALYDLGRTTGLRVDAPREAGWGDRAITVDTGERPFWDAWQRFCSAAGIHEPGVPSASEYLEVREGRRVAPGPVAVAEAAGLRLRLFHWNEAKRGGDRPSANHLVEIWCDPRFELWDVSGLTLAPPATSLFGGRGSGLIDARSRRLVAPKQAFFVALNMPVTDKPGELPGSVAARFLVNKAALAVPDLMNAAGKSFRDAAGLRLDVLDVGRTADGDVAVRLRLDGFESASSGRFADAVRVRPQVVVPRQPDAVFLPPIELVDAKGRPWECAETTRTGPTVGPQECRLTFQARGGSAEELSLVVVRQRVVTVDVPFTLRAPPGEKAR